MTRIIPPLHENHAPIHLQDAFSEAISAFEDWDLGNPEPKVSVDGKQVPISSIFGRLRASDDLLPEKVRLAVKPVLPQLGSESSEAATYGDLAVRLRAVCVERLRSSGDGNHFL